MTKMSVNFLTKGDKLVTRMLCQHETVLPSPSTNGRPAAATSASTAVSLAVSHVVLAFMSSAGVRVRPPQAVSP